MAGGSTNSIDRLSGGATVIIALFTVGFPLVRLQAIEYAHLAAFQDDFFYYLTIARNLATAHQSTFDFIGVTNGYHPLWMGVLILLVFVADPRSLKFVILLQALAFAFILLSAWLFSRLARLTFPNHARAQAVAGLFFVFLYANLTRTGMEVIVTVPAMLAAMLACLRFWESPSRRWLFTATTLLSLTILSRIDSGLFVVILVLTSVFLQGRSRRKEALRFLATPRVLVIAIVGIAPVVTYLLMNMWVFGGLLPQNSVAKQIRSSFAINNRVFEFLFTFRNDPRNLVFFFLMATLPSALVLCGLFVLPFRSNGMPRSARIVVVSTATFAFAYYCALAIATDWGLWIWYLYPSVVGGSFAALWLLTMMPTLPAAQWLVEAAAVPAVAAFCIALSAAATITRDPASNTIHWAALRLSEFAETHPGVYAMGDRAGFAGFLLPSGLVQLEGLVSDRSLLPLIRNNAPLEAAFKRFNVDYYVTADVRQSGGCFWVEEPKTGQAGTRSKRMSGKLCTEPVARWTDSAGGSTMVFYVGSQGASPGATRP